MSKLLSRLCFALSVIATPLRADVAGEVLSYKDGDTNMIGYVAYDNAIDGRRPGVIVVPDWWGHGQFVRDRANALAKQGYTAMVMDIYGEGTYVEPPNQAQVLMNGFTSDPKAMETRFEATQHALKQHKTVDGRKIAAIGYSLGGMVVLEMARRGKELDGVASIWGVIGKPAKPAEKGKVKASILVQQPEKDSWAPMESVNALEKEMNAAGTEVKVIVYPGTAHGYTRPDASTRAEKYGLGIRYHEKATEQSQKDLNEFLKSVFQ